MTGYIYMYPLMEPQPFADQMQQEMIRQIESASTEYTIAVLVSASGSTPWSGRKIIQLVVAFIRNQSHVGWGRCPGSPNGSHYFWGPEVSNYPGLPQRGILVYQRKASE